MLDCIKALIKNNVRFGYKSAHYGDEDIRTTKGEKTFFSYTPIRQKSSTAYPIEQVRIKNSALTKLGLSKKNRNAFITKREKKEEYHYIKSLKKIIREIKTVVAK